MTKHLPLALVVLVACGSRGSNAERHAVGTFIGGGSIFGSDDCEYTGTPGVFVDSAKPARGPRFVRGTGTITVTCPKVTREVRAVEPTAAKLWGPRAVKAGTTSELFTASLAAGDHVLFGEARIEWSLGADCNGIATFGPVLGAQDTGGKDRSRTLVTTGKGTCTVIVALATGNPDESYPGKGYQAQQLVTIE